MGEEKWSFKEFIKVNLYRHLNSSNSIQISDDASKKLEVIIQKIPKRKDELFSFKINWDIFERSNLIEKKLRPWLV